MTRNSNFRRSIELYKKLQAYSARYIEPLLFRTFFSPWRGPWSDYHLNLALFLPHTFKIWLNGCGFVAYLITGCWCVKLLPRNFSLAEYLEINFGLKNDSPMSPNYSLNFPRKQTQDSPDSSHLFAALTKAIIQSKGGTWGSFQTLQKGRVPELSNKSTRLFISLMINLKSL